MNRTRWQLSGLARMAVLALFLAAIAACSGTPGSQQPPSPGISVPSPQNSATSTPNPTNSPPVTGTIPGQSTPQAIVAAFIDANQVALSTTNYSQACTLVVPSEQPGCPAALSSATLSVIGPVTIGQADVVGDMAIVVVLGRICGDLTCSPNTNPSAGLPSSPADFANAYQTAINVFAEPSAQFACKQEANLWYVDLGANL